MTDDGAGLPAPDRLPEHSPQPTPAQRAAGVAALVGAILWPLALLALADASLSDCVNGASCLPASTAVAPLALATILMTVGIAGLETRAPGEMGLADLVGDLTIGTAAALFTLVVALGAVGLIGPGFLLLVIGSVIFGVRGWNGRRRAQFGSMLVAIGMLTVLVFVLLASTVGTSTVGGFESPALVGLLIYAVGWGWLGLSLALGRPLAPPPYKDPKTAPRALRGTKPRQ